MQNHKQKPWEDQYGVRLNERDLKLASQNWIREEWEEYLSSTETPLRESLVNDFDAFVHQVSFDTSNRTSKITRTPNAKSRQIDKLLKKLSYHEERILRLTFWEGKTIRETAEILSLPKSTVADNKQRALSKCRGLLSGKVIENEPTTC